MSRAPSCINVASALVPTGLAPNENTARPLVRVGGVRADGRLLESSAVLVGAAVVPAVEGL